MNIIQIIVIIWIIIILFFKTKLGYKKSIPFIVKYPDYFSMLTKMEYCYLVILLKHSHSYYYFSILIRMSIQFSTFNFCHWFLAGNLSGFGILSWRPNWRINISIRCLSGLRITVTVAGRLLGVFLGGVITFFLIRAPRICLLCLHLNHWSDQLGKKKERKWLILYFPKDS